MNSLLAISSRQSLVDVSKLRDWAVHGVPQEVRKRFVDKEIRDIDILHHLQVRGEVWKYLLRVADPDQCALMIEIMSSGMLEGEVF